MVPISFSNSCIHSSLGSCSFHVLSACIYSHASHLLLQPLHSELFTEFFLPCLKCMHIHTCMLPISFSNPSIHNSSRRCVFHVLTACIYSNASCLLLQPFCSKQFTEPFLSCLFRAPLITTRKKCILFSLLHSRKSSCFYFYKTNTLH